MTSPAPRKTSVPTSRCAIRRVSQIRPAPLRRRQQKWSFPGRSAPVPVRSLATPPGEHTAGDTGACAEKGCGVGQTAELPVVPLKHEKLDPCSSGGRSPGDVPPVPCADKGPVVGSGPRCLVSGHHNGRAGGVWFQDIVPSVCRDIIPGCAGTSFPIATTNKNEAIIYAITEAGMSINEAAERFSLSARWIRVLLGRYHDGGIAALEPSRVLCRYFVGSGSRLRAALWSVSNSTGVSIPREPWRRRLLYQSTQPAVANSTSARVR